jgi:hypothetical protein
MGDKNQVQIGLSYRPAYQHRLAESISGLHLNVYKFGLYDMVGAFALLDPSLFIVHKLHTFKNVLTRGRL